MADLIIPGLADGGGYPVDEPPVTPPYPHLVLRAAHGSPLSVSSGMSSFRRYHDLPEETLTQMKSRASARPGAFITSTPEEGPTTVIHRQGSSPP